jgi:ribosomal protein S18 acetylase RimI-like enzyme
MTAPPPPTTLLPLLESDRVWCAYALADLDPHYAADCTWLVGDGAVVLIYSGLTPPVLFAHGEPEPASRLLDQVPGGRYQFTLMGVHRDLLGSRLAPEFENSMWRMVLQTAAFPGSSDSQAVRLDSSDLADILSLMADHPDRPDAFSETQLAQGVFCGIRRADRLVSMAGTHVLAPASDVAAIGNVFTHPDLRGQGLGTQVTASVIAELIRTGIGTVVLNVGMDNQPAIRVYRKLGFWPYRGYYEGVAHLKEKR